MLGRAGMADLAGDLTALLGVPVVDGVAVTVLEGLARQGLTTGTRGEYAPPPIRAPSAGIR